MSDIQIKLHSEKNKQIEDFKMDAWKKVHVKHYGEEFNFEYWDKKKLVLEARKDEKVVGVLIGSFMAGVLNISEFIVDETHKGMGIGVKLLREAEKWTRDQKGHSLYLETGSDWGARKFYLDNGFKVVADLKNHFSKVDFVVMTKTLGNN